MNILVTGSEERNSKGQFVRTREPWEPSDWDAGFVDNTGRFRVYRPDYPKAWQYKTCKGYAFRAHIVWWLQTGDVVPDDEDLHHIDGDRLNDLPENLIVLTRSEHHSIDRASCSSKVCKHCGESFWIKNGRLNSGRTRGSYCNQECYHAHARSQKHKQAISLGLQLAYAKGRR